MTTVLATSAVENTTASPTVGTITSGLHDVSAQTTAWSLDGIANTTSDALANNTTTQGEQEVCLTIPWLAVYVGCGFVAGGLVISWLLGIIKLCQKRKRLFKEKLVPSPGRWEGASDPVTDKVIRQHALEQLHKVNVEASRLSKTEEGFTLETTEANAGHDTASTDINQVRYDKRGIIGRLLNDGADGIQEPSTNYHDIGNFDDTSQKKNNDRDNGNDSEVNREVGIHVADVVEYEHEGNASIEVADEAQLQVDGIVNVVPLEEAVKHIINGLCEGADTSDIKYDDSEQDGDRGLRTIEVEVHSCDSVFGGIENNHGEFYDNSVNNGALYKAGAHNENLVKDRIPISMTDGNIGNGEHDNHVNGVREINASGAAILCNMDEIDSCSENKVEMYEPDRDTISSETHDVMTLENENFRNKF